MQGNEGLIPAKDALDHLLLGVAMLEEGIAWVERNTGVRATLGGSHPGAGTHNALLSLGHRQYLEIIAPDPNQTPDGPLAPVLKELRTPRPVGWAAATSDIDALARGLHTAGLSFEGPRPGSRKRPDGSHLIWRTLRLSGQPCGVIPFFIEWATSTVHPAVDSPSGCLLTSFELEDPDPEATRQMLKTLGILADIKRSDHPTLKIQLECRKKVLPFG
jgi:hypothetical protein